MYYYVTKKYPNDKPIKSMKHIPKVTQKLLGIKNVALYDLKHHWSDAYPLNDSQKELIMKYRKEVK